MGIPEYQRRNFWLCVSGAYSYLRDYSNGYYETISKDESEEAYPTWPHPDYQSI
jgi:hypothetical protein